MNVGIVGLGLIGGSLAKALKQDTPHIVLGRDINDQVVCKAKLFDAIDEELTDKRINICDIIILAVYPADTVRFLTDHADDIAPGATVVDTCGVKDAVCRRAFSIARDHGFVFIGGHPMAGTEYSGFEFAQHSLIKNASMIMTPPRDVPIEALDRLKKLFVSIGFTNIEITTPKEHDRIIAYTSQLAHIVSSAYIKSDAARAHHGFSAGSYRDMTRVAKLNEDMWTELFMDNRENLAHEADRLIHELQKYSEAIKLGDAQQLHTLLKEGREMKLMTDKEDYGL
jgi:prephenate dehydrogenase